MRFPTCLFGASLLTLAACLDFINPPKFGTVGDFSQNPVYARGSTIDVRWSDVQRDAPISVTLFQLDGVNYVPDFEYITKSVVNEQSFTWIVATTKNLTFSNMFYMSIFTEGSTTGSANSHYFNISFIGPPQRPRPGPSTSSSPPLDATGAPSSLLSTSTPTQTTPSTSTYTLSQSSPALQPPPSAQQQQSSSNPSTYAKIGMGIGIPLALAFGLGAGYLIFRHRKRQSDHDMRPMRDSPYPHLTHYGGQGAMESYPKDTHATYRHANAGFVPAEVGGMGEAAELGEGVKDGGERGERRHELGS